MHTSNRSACHPCSNRVSATSRTAVYGPVRTVVWEGRGRELPPIPIFGTLEEKNLKTETAAPSRQADASACAEALLQYVTASELHPRLRWAPLPLRRAFVPTYFRLDFGRCHEGKEFRYRHCGASGPYLRSGK